VPAGTPSNIVELLNRQIAKIISLPDVKARLATIGFDPMLGTPEDFANHIKAESAEWGRVVREAHIKID
jgi:tripartite-type tricarboxylate transporter receptor subunit TctC